MTPSVEVALANLNGRLDAIVAGWDAHNTQHQEQFDSIDDQLKELDGKVDALLLREAFAKGEAKGIKKTASMLAGIISVLVSLATVFIVV
jgi:cell division protein FtsX